MTQITVRQNQLAKLRDTEIDLSEFGQEPLLLAQVSDDPMHMGVIGIVASILMLAAPGFNWLLLAGFWLFNANDIVWALGEDVEDEDDGPVVDTSAQEVVDDVEADPAQQPQQSDNWVDEAVDDGSYSLPETQAKTWPPVVETVPVTVGFQRAIDVIADTTPADLLNLMGDDAPNWLKRVAVSEGAFVPPEPLECERLDVPESLVEPGFEPVQEDGSVHGSGSGSVQEFSGSDHEQALVKAVDNGPYVVPVIGIKGQCYWLVRTAIALGKSQTWIVENLFGAKKGGSIAYKNAVAYIKWVKEQ